MRALSPSRSECYAIQAKEYNDLAKMHEEMAKAAK
jgi:hypothetical protein